MFPHHQIIQVIRACIKLFFVFFLTFILSSRYRENAKKTSALFRDNPLTPLEKAVYWIEFVARHGGTAHLRTAANDLHWFQRLLLDVVLVAVVLVVAFLWTTKKIVVFTFRKCCGRKRHVAKTTAAVDADTSEEQKKHQ